MKRKAIATNARHRRLGLPCALTVVLALVSTVASADVTKDQCVDANTKAQPLRREGKLAEAREELAVCISVRCPRLVRDDCKQMLDELDRAQPSVVFAASDPAGSSLTEVKVTIDGRPFAERLDGRSLAADPGEHTFVFEVAGQPPVERKLVLKEGEKDRRERIVVGMAAAPAIQAGSGHAAAAESSASPLGAGGAEDRAASLPDHVSSSGPSKTIALVLGGLGVAGIAAGSVFGLMANSAWSDSKAECPSSNPCTDHAKAVVDHDTAARDATISTIGFIAGGALIAGGVALFIAAPSATEQPSGVTLRFAPSLGARHAGIAVGGEF